MTLTLTYAARSDRGLVRTNNEDSVYAGARLLALADGMGGHAAGEIASQLMVSALAPLDNDEPGGDMLSKMYEAMNVGNDAIAAQVEHDPDLDGMGTTLTAILFAGSKIGLLHVGDSRGYLLRDGKLTQITKDDTYVQTLVDDGTISADEAHTHPRRSLIMKALTGQPIEPTLTMREAHLGDRYLLCSDGLTDVVSDDTISETLSEITDAGEAAGRLIELALKSGGPDNVTILIADVIDAEYGSTKPIVAGALSEDDLDDDPPPNTAAGRAAKMRPPRTPTKRPAYAHTEAPRRNTRRRRAIIAASAFAVGILLVGGIVVVNAMVSRNYFVTIAAGSVQINKGIVGFNGAAETACVSEHNPPRLDSVDVTFVSAHAVPAGCKRLKFADLNPTGQSALGSLPSSNTLPAAENQIRELVKKMNPPCDTNILPKPAPTPTHPVTAPSSAPPSPITPPTDSVSKQPPPAAPAATPAVPVPSSAPQAECREIA